MAGRAEELFERLQDAASIVALIREPEDAHLDCKEWPAKEDEAQKMLAKAVCGMANADGGVLVIGMKAESRPKDEPDIITAAAPVADRSLVRSRILGLIGNLVEPGIVGLQATEIADKQGAKSGFVVLHVPRHEGSPCRSRKDSRFYQRIGSSTLPMEYRQIESMFGTRALPALELHLDAREIGQTAYSGQPLRQFAIGLTNTGRGIAKFPGLQFKRSTFSMNQFGIDGNYNFGIRLRPSESPDVIFGGGVDDVIYPGQTLLIGRLVQSGINKGIEGIPGTMTVIRNHREVLARWVFAETVFACEISCEGCETKAVQRLVPEAEVILQT